MLPRPRFRSIALWCLLLSGTAGGALWASARPGWLQDRMFGLSPVPVQPANQSDDAIRRWVVARFDAIEGDSIEARCSGDRSFVEFENGQAGLYGGIVHFEGRQVSAGMVDGGTVRELRQPYPIILKLQLWMIRDDVARMRPLPPSYVARTHPPILAVDGDQVHFAVCERGRFWVAIAPSPDENSAIGRAAREFSGYLYPSYPPPMP